MCRRAVSNRPPALDGSGRVLGTCSGIAPDLHHRNRTGKLRVGPHSVTIPGPTNTDPKNLRLRRHRPEDPVLQITFDANDEVVLQATAHRDRLAHTIG
jgi:hypothetical protein